MAKGFNLGHLLDRLDFYKIQARPMSLPQWEIKTIRIERVWNYEEALHRDITFMTKNGATKAGVIITDGTVVVDHDPEAIVITHPRPRWAISKIAEVFHQPHAFASWTGGITVYDTVEFGKNFKSKPGTVLGGAGFGYEWGGAYGYFQMPHLGKVIIGDNVNLGSLNCVDRGTFSDTIIGDGTKTDNMVHIAHNCRIGKDVMFAAGVKLSGSVTIGDGVWMGTNSTVMQGVTIGEEATIGLGAVVLRDVEPGQTIVGHHRIIETKEEQPGVIR